MKAEFSENIHGEIFDKNLRRVNVDWARATVDFISKMTWPKNMTLTNVQHYHFEVQIIIF